MESSVENMSCFMNLRQVMKLFCPCLSGRVQRLQRPARTGPALSRRPRVRCARAASSTPRASARRPPASSSGVNSNRDSQKIRRAIADEIIVGASPILAVQIQPASLDLRLSDRAYRVPTSFLPNLSRTWSAFTWKPRKRSKTTSAKRPVSPARLWSALASILSPLRT